ncbi:uncharacterized protein LOC126881561 [Diabrotica virgifera virgifera]|uniref:Uncharacterized protein LOC114343342 n=1 Tax=Diabrotica virgifera virgifera TaxID=50390 RepID=A0A6P7GJ62_DIAVI|nr:uncharacterized protein LOC126881561 [Diabrotica virgifera virgifera]
MTSTPYDEDDIDRFSGRIQEVFKDPKCTDIYLKYLREVKQEEKYEHVFNLWKKANGTEEYSDSVFIDPINKVVPLFDKTDFDKSKKHEKIACIVDECCRILNRDAHKCFITYLKQHNK